MIDAMACQVRHMKRQLVEGWHAPLYAPAPYSERFRTIHWCVDQFMEHLLIVFEPKLRDSWLTWSNSPTEPRNYLAGRYSDEQLSPTERRAVHLSGLVSYADWYLYAPSLEITPAGRERDWKDTYDRRRGAGRSGPEDEEHIYQKPRDPLVERFCKRGTHREWLCYLKVWLQPHHNAIKAGHAFMSLVDKLAECLHPRFIATHLNLPREDGTVNSACGDYLGTGLSRHDGWRTLPGPPFRHPLMYRLLSHARKDVIQMGSKVAELETLLMFIANELTPKDPFGELGASVQENLYIQFTSLSMPGHAAGVWTTMDEDDSQRLSYRELRSIILCPRRDHPALRTFVLDTGNLGRLCQRANNRGQHHGDKFSEASSSRYLDQQRYRFCRLWHRHYYTSGPAPSDCTAYLEWGCPVPYNSIPYIEALRQGDYRSPRPIWAQVWVSVHGWTASYRFIPIPKWAQLCPIRAGLHPTWLPGVVACHQPSPDDSSRGHDFPWAPMRTSKATNFKNDARRSIPYDDSDDSVALGS